MCDKPQNGPRWINPCNLSGTAQEIRDQPVENLNVTLLTPIVVSARQTLDLANNLKENYAKVIFKQGAAQVENLLRDQKYNWLPQLPDTRDERAFRDHAKALPWQRALLESYKYLQTIAVGLEQVTSDFENDPIDSMKENFTEINNHVHNVLCELQMSIIDHNLKIERDVGRDAMPQMYREICESRSRRSERDWIILRECINVLEYTIGVFTHLSN
ncbi:uncharacterized protein LOC132702019 [Cylas formicarius]|uniref:uncharacterized protein LOC132702019 n=1 Tax=Cylas formicarius TaxID=197179 RepID=UPI00295854FD|nr:uncharacterized protein LOC132702019 [Cylas formicarius]